MLKRIIFFVRIASVVTVTMVSIYSQTAQDPRSAAESEALAPAPEPQQLTRPDCVARQAIAYSSILAFLDHQPTASTAELRTSLAGLVGDPEGLDMIRLGAVGAPIVAAYSCGYDASNYLGSFRVFTNTGAGYAVAASSDSEPSLSESDAEGVPVTNGFVQLFSLSDGKHFATVWTRGGARPAVFSTYVWSWDSGKLSPTWKQTYLRGGNVDIVGRVLFVTGVPPTSYEPGLVPERTAYHLNREGNVESDGPVDAALMERYEREKILTANTPAEMEILAQRWADIGAVDKQLALYDRAAQSAGFEHLYLSAADVLEKQGKYNEAIIQLRAYERKIESTLTPASSKDIEERITRLRMRTPGR